MTQPTIQNNIDLQPFNTMGFPVHAANYVSIESDEALAEFFVAQSRANQLLNCFVLGGGSNLVLTKDIAGYVLHMRQRGVRIISENDTHVSVAVAAGEVWHEWVMSSVARGWMGLENLALIPGSVGACPVQNIGAYGAEVKDTIVMVKAWDRVKQVFVELDNAFCQFTYRDSVFKEAWLDVDGYPQSRYIITEVVFKLLKDATQWQAKVAYGDVAIKAAELANGAALTAQHVAQAIIAIRQSKLPNPADLGNAGSFFKNPVVGADVVLNLKEHYPNLPNYPQADGSVKIAAGWLIEQAGFKGLRAGAVGVYEKQALVLVHYGQGTGLELMAFAQRVSDSVFDKFGVRISPEPVVY